MTNEELAAWVDGQVPLTGADDAGPDHLPAGAARLRADAATIAQLTAAQAPVDPQPSPAAPTPHDPPTRTYCIEWGGMYAHFEATGAAQARWQAGKALCEAGYVPRAGDAFKRPMRVSRA